MRSYALNKWITDGDFGYDIGIIDLDCRIGNSTGTLGFGVQQGNATNFYVGLAGYVIDISNNLYSTLWSGGGYIRSANNTYYYYDNDTEVGESGGPVYKTDVNDCGVICVIAVNSAEYDPPTLNSGSRITLDVFNWLLVKQSYIAGKIYLPIIINQ